MNDGNFEKAEHVVLTSHKTQIFKDSIPINWGATDPSKRGPIIATTSCENKRNAIGTHSGSYTVYRALSIANKTYPKSHVPDLNNTHATTEIGPFDSWFDPKRIVSIDPWGGHVQTLFKDKIKNGYDIRPTIAVTQARLQIPEIANAIAAGRLIPDGKIILEN